MFNIQKRFNVYINLTILTSSQKRFNKNLTFSRYSIITRLVAARSVIKALRAATTTAGTRWRSLRSPLNAAEVQRGVAVHKHGIPAQAKA